MRALITGGAGFIGSHLVEELNKRRISCVIIDDLSTGKKKNLNGLRYDFFKINICSPQLVPIIKKIKPDLVFHLAAQSSISLASKNPKANLKINLFGTLNLLSAFKNFKIKKILFASSAAVYGNQKKYPIEENFPKNPFSAYGISKLSSEILVSNWAKNHSIPHTNLRFSNVYGERQDSSTEGGVVSIFIDNLLKNNPVTIFNSGKQTRDFIYVKDVIFAILKSIDEKMAGTYNIATSNETSINNLLKLLEKVSKIKAIKSYRKRKLIEVERNVLSYTKFFNGTRWKPRTKIENGLKKTFVYFRSLL